MQASQKGSNGLYQSGIYKGVISHKRFSPKPHQFSYKISMLGFVLEELDHVTSEHLLLGTQWFNPLQFNEKDYLKSELGSLKQRIANKVKQLGGKWDEYKVFMLVQCRCLGVYFSPINFYYCIDVEGQCSLVLAEVSNTPWNERHYYLVNVDPTQMNDGQQDYIDKKYINKKDFHVSPFMELNMNYHWLIKHSPDDFLINIQNFTPISVANKAEKVFEANMILSKQQLKSFALIKSWLSLPFTVVKIVSLIYWQALKLFIKKIPIVDKT